MNSKNNAMKTGWIIGWDNNTGDGTILNTNDCGKNWTAQGDPMLLKGYSGNDISAVDENTAWAALGSVDLKSGRILHTTNGGLIWKEQALPEGVNDAVKGIKGLSPTEAWAATLNGTILHTTDGGQLWVVVPHPGVDIHKVNRIDADLEGNLWVADTFGEGKGMIRSTNYGKEWGYETLPDLMNNRGPIGVSAKGTTVWGAQSLQGDLYRQLGGGDWEKSAPGLGGPFDFDDICATGEKTAWAVLNRGGGVGGTIFHVAVTNEGAVKESYSPVDHYEYEGITCFSDIEVFVVGYKSSGGPEDLPVGVILYIADNGIWTSQKVPNNNSKLWKVSFVGANR